MSSINFCRNLINPVVIQSGLLLRSQSVIQSRCQLGSFASYSRWQGIKSNPKFRFLVVGGVSFTLATVFITGTEYIKLDNVFTRFKVKKSSSLNVIPEIVSLSNVPDVQPSRIVSQFYYQ